MELLQWNIQFEIPPDISDIYADVIRPNQRLIKSKPPLYYVTSTPQNLISVTGVMKDLSIPSSFQIPIQLDIPLLLFEIPIFWGFFIEAVRRK